MNILSEEEKKVKNLIKKMLNNPGYELEMLILKKKLDYYHFQNILKRFLYKKEHHGYELPYEYISHLRVIDQLNFERDTIIGLDNIKHYWLTNTLLDEKKRESIKKISIDKIDLRDYPLRINVKEEKEAKLNLLEDTEKTKFFRLQNRYSFFTEDKMFKIDFTVVKSSPGKTFQDSNVLNEYQHYEIEIEFLRTSKDVEDIMRKMFQWAYIILCEYYNSGYIIPSYLREDILKEYYVFIHKNERIRKTNREFELKSKDFIAVNPVTLQLENMRPNPRIPNILRNYGVTYKADGKRMLLYILGKMDKENREGEVYLMDNNFNVLFTGVTMKTWANTIIEGEYIEETESFYMYDILFSKGLDIRNKPLYENESGRLMYLQDFEKEVAKQEGKLYMKKYYFGNGVEIFMYSNKLWKERNHQPFQVDGLIYTPKIEPYPDNRKTWDRLFKWKPPYLNTIDFLVKLKKDEETNKDLVLPYIGKNKKIKQYKIIQLYMSVTIEKYNMASGKMKRMRGPKLFQEAQMPVKGDSKIYARDPLTNVVTEVIEDTIVEFAYHMNEEFPWVPIRIRYDKTEQYHRNKDIFGNDERTVMNIWKSIKNPVTEHMIMTGVVSEETEENKVLYTSVEDVKREKYQNFHNVIVKRKLLHMKDKEIKYTLDLGSGRGADLNKWIELKFERVVGIDIDPDSVYQAMERYEKRKEEIRVTFLCGDVTKLIFPDYESACPNTEYRGMVMNWKNKMKENIPQKYMFDMVSSQFMIHYAFKNERTLRGYLQNVTDNLRIGGVFVGTTFDGNKVYNLLKKKKSIEGKNDKGEKIWEITKLYEKKFGKDRPNWGMEIDVYIRTIGITHKESLVSLIYLEKIGVEYGLELRMIKDFQEYYEEAVKEGKYDTIVKEMNQDEKTFSFLNVAFVFEKVRVENVNVMKKYKNVEKRLK